MAENKGFTLIELLAVIIILSLLALITSTTVTKILKDSKNEIYGIQLSVIKSTAKTWGLENLDKMPSTSECGYITLLDLKNSGLLDDSIKDFRSNTELGNINIKITSSLNSKDKLVYFYEVDSDDVSECRYLNN